MLITFHERCSRCRKRASHTEELKHLTRFRFRLLLPHLCYVKSFSSLSCAAPERPGQAGCGSADVGYDGPGWMDHGKIMFYHLVNADSVNHAGIPSNLRLSPSGCFRAEQQTRNRKRFAPVRGFPIDPSRNGNGPLGARATLLAATRKGKHIAEEPVQPSGSLALAFAGLGCPLWVLACGKAPAPPRLDHQQTG